MAKCIRCGKSTIVRGHVKLADSAICTPCFKGLGFKLTDTAGATIYKYDDIKNGKDAYYSNEINKAAERYDQEQDSVRGFQFAHYSELRGLDATEGEMEIYETVCEILDDEGLDVEALELVRKSDSYLTIVLGPTDVARIKYTDRVKWILFPYGSNEKIRISSVDAINSHTRQLTEAYETAESINSKA